MDLFGDELRELTQMNGIVVETCIVFHQVIELNDYSVELHVIS